MVYFPYARLRNSETTGAIIGHEALDYNNGIYIDIYVVDGYTDNRALWSLQTILRAITIKFCTLRWPKRSKCDLTHKVVDCMRPIVSIGSHRMWHGLARLVLSMYNKSAVRFGPRYRMHPMASKWWIEKSAFDNLIELPYENLMLPCPRDYDAHLRRMYGDYMKFPPPEERGKWHEGIIHFEPDVPYYNKKSMHAKGAK